MPVTSFEHDIKPLFLAFDRDAMLFAFDLWSHRDVADNATMIVHRLEAGDMPCDRPWPQQHLTLFRSWMQDGCPL
jgi:hypothetical protein